MNPIFFPLDGMNVKEALEKAALLQGKVFGFKINDLLDDEGVQIVPKLKKFGRLWADNKFKDIPNTVGNRVKKWSDAGADFITVHASGGIEMMMKAVANRGKSKILAVTVLTSHQEDNAHLAYGSPSKAKVIQLARWAKLAGVDAIVCSGEELEVLGQQPELSDLIKVVPGIRPIWYQKPDDQKKKKTPVQAIELGADFLVIGRPIAEADDPLQAIDKTMAEISEALKKNEEKRKKDLAFALFDAHTIKFGEFRLKSHETDPNLPLSPIYVDLRLLRSHPKVMDKVVKTFRREIFWRGLEFDLLSDIPISITPVVSNLSRDTGIPMISPRLDKKTHGSGAKIEGEYKEGQTVLLLDDLVTKATSTLETSEILSKKGLILKDIMVLVDREQGGSDKLKSSGFNFHSVFTLMELLNIYKDNEKITSEQFEKTVKYLNS